MSKDTCVVVTVRMKRETLALSFGGMTATVELSGITSTRCKAVIKAPREVNVRRIPHAVESEEVQP